MRHLLLLLLCVVCLAEKRLLTVPSRKTNTQTPADLLKQDGVQPGTYIALGVLGVFGLFMAMLTCGGGRAKLVKMTQNRANKREKDAAKSSANFTSLPSNIKAASETGDARAIRRWVAIDTTDVDSRDDNGRTALHTSSKGGHRDIIRLLLEAGADVDAEDNERVTALHLAARHGFGLCVKVLLDGGANPSAMDSSGNTAVENAQSSGNVGCLKLIQRRINLENADPNVKVRLRQAPSSDLV